MQGLLISQDDDPFAKALAPALKELNIRHECYGQYSFADGETWFQIGETQARFSAATLIYRFDAKSTINDQLCLLLLLIAKLKKHLRQIPIVLILPYFPYARQDKEKNSLNISMASNEIIAEMFAHAGVTWCITYDIHSLPKVFRSLIDIESVDVTDMWVNVAKKIIQNNNVWSIAAPDDGGKFRSQKLAERLGIEVVFISKIRTRPDHVASSNLLGNVAGRSVILVDDIISTGRTAVSACQELLDQGAKEVIGFFTHAVLASGAKERIDESGFTSVYVTDTLLHTDDALPKKGVIVPIDQYYTMLLNVLTKNEYQQKSANAKVQ